MLCKISYCISDHAVYIALEIFCIKVHLPEVLPNDDLSALTELTEAVILQELQQRYNINQIYVCNLIYP